ncbi:MAG: VOC family protein [Flavobacteriales bacterium]|nr:VOC family protein [Flavobacteriales bacterium]
MKTYLEHANISVPSIDEAIAFLKLIAPDFDLRQDDSSGEDPPRWVHFGTSDSYIALQAIDPRHQPKKPLRTYINYGINHLALVVEDFDAVESRLLENGYQKGIAIEDEPFRKRAYFFDHAGFEWEIVQYLSDIPAEKNKYIP